MRETLTEPLYYTSKEDIPDSIIVNRKDYIVSENITHELIKKISMFDYKVVFIGYENIFSHAMNVLRKVSSSRKTIIVVGIHSIKNALLNSKSCVLLLKENTIILDGKEYSFQKFSLELDADEEIEYNVDTEYICYKPDYHYSNELAEIVREGFNHSQINVKGFSDTIVSKDRKVWNYGIGFPSEIYGKICLNLKEYYQLLLEYLNVLKNLTKYYYKNECCDEIVSLLKQHFSYSTLFSFNLSTISVALHEELDEETVEGCYAIFAIISPISDKQNMTGVAIKKAERLLSCLSCNEKSAFTDIYPEFNGVEITDTVILFFVMNLFSDIRRCIIGMLMENNTWFASICTHKRRKNTVY